MRFYNTVEQAAQAEIIPMLGSEAGAYDIDALTLEVFTVDPVSGMLTHTGAGITDEMLDRHAR